MMKCARLKEISAVVVVACTMLAQGAQAPAVPAAPSVKAAQPTEQYRKTKPAPSTKSQIGELNLGMLYPQHVLGEDASIVHPSRTVLIFLNDSEVGIEGVTDTALAALYQEAGPIIISGSLLQNVFSPFTGNEIQSVVASQFKPEHWFVTEINQNLFLLVPIDQLQGNDKLDRDGFSERELNLGLKIDHMVKIVGTLKEKFSAYKRPPRSENYFIQSITDGSVFMTRSEYTKLDAAHKKQFILPQWSVYITGHGSIGTTIAGLPIAEFQKFLEFLNTKVLTKLFVYSSCYAAGSNVELVYKDLEKASNIQKIFPFPIVLEGSPDVVVSNFPPKIALAVVQFDHNFKTIDDSGFLNQTNKNEPVALSKVLKPIFESLRNILDNNKVYFIDNYPMIRPANREQFISLLPGIEITKTMAATRTAPLDVIESAKRKGVEWKTTHVFLKVNRVPFPLILKKGQSTVPIFFSTLPNEPIHIIDRIESEYSLTGASFAYSMSKNNPKALFWIRTFIDKSSTPHITYEDVIIDTRNKGGVFCYATEAATQKRFSLSGYGDINYIDDPYMKNYGSLRLWQAIDVNDLKSIKDLLEQGVVPDEALLAELRAQGKKEILSLLDVAVQRKEANKMLQDAMTVQDIAAIAKSLKMGAKDLLELPLDVKDEILKMLLEAGINIPKEKLEYLLRDQIYSNNDYLVRLLLTAKASANTVNNNGDTALMIAVRYDKSLTIIQLLLDAGADVTAKNKKNQTVFDIATKKEVKELLQKYKKTNPKEAATAMLHDAIGKRDVAGVENALKQGADVNAEVGPGGLQALDRALNNVEQEEPTKQLNIVKFLLEAGAAAGYTGGYDDILEGFSAPYSKKPADLVKLLQQYAPKQEPASK